jgi:hypothetical protein
MKKLNIWLIQPGEPLPVQENVKKMRTAHLAEKLIEKGHSIVWWTSAFDHVKKEWIVRRDTEMTPSPGVKITAMKGTGYSRNMSVSRFIDHRLVAQKFKQLSKRMEKPDIIIASTPPHDLAYQAVQFAKKKLSP